MNLQTRRLGRSIFATLRLGFSLLFVTRAMAATDPVSEMGAFSVFGKVDVNELARSDVKTVHGPPMSGRFLSVQSSYVAPGPPEKQIEALRQWDPTRHPDLKVFLHSDLPAAPTAAKFAKLKNAPDNAPVRAFVAATEKLGADLQISKEEAKKPPTGGGGGVMPASVVNFWGELLAAR